MSENEIVIERLTRVLGKDYEDISLLLPQLTERAHISEEELKRAVDNNDTHIFVARDNGKIVGTGILVVMHVLVERLGRIQDVVVDEAYRGKGIGKKLMEYLVLAARGKGLDAIELSSSKHRKVAHTLYEKLGFDQKDTNVYRLEL